MASSNASRESRFADTKETVLNDRERRIFEARWLADELITLEELADEFGVSKERVRQIEVRAIEKVKKANGVALDQQRSRGLTRREREVLLLVGTGMSNKDIAHQLGLTDGTVKQYVYRIFQKTGARNRSYLVAQIATQSSVA